MIAVSFAATAQEQSISFNTMTQFVYNAGTTEYDFRGETVASKIDVSISDNDKSVVFIMEYEGDRYIIEMSKARVYDMVENNGVHFAHIVGYVNGSRSEVYISRIRVELFLHDKGVAYLMYNTDKQKAKI